MWKFLNDLKPMHEIRKKTGMKKEHEDFISYKFFFNKLHSENTF